MKLALKLLVVVLLLAVSTTNAASFNTCSTVIQGGSDAFPWNIAEPFPWKIIQGVWKVHNNPELLFQFRVNNPNKINRRLSVQIFSRENCTKPLYKVPGVISDREKNVVHLQMEDKLIKLAWFNTESLNLNPYQCGEYVMAASMRASEESLRHFSTLNLVDVELPPIDQDDENSGNENFFLKKISNSLEIYCKRRI